MSHVLEKPVRVNMGESGLVIRLAHAQCSVLSPRTGNRVFPRPGPYLSVYGVILYMCCL